MEFLRRFPASLWLLLVALLSLAVAIAGPALRVVRNVYDYVFIIDISQSMGTEDVVWNGKAVSRLAQVKANLHQVLLKLPCGSKAGLGVFVEYRAYLLTTPVDVCRNFSDIAHSLDNISGAMAWAGASEIRKGLNWGFKLTLALDPPPNFVFFTDGHEAPPVNPKLLPRIDIAPGKVSGLLVGVGGSELAPIPKFDPEGKRIGFWKSNEVMQIDIYSAARSGTNDTEKSAGAQRKDKPAGTEHLSSLKQDYLQGLARETGLRYTRLLDAQSLTDALQGTRLARPSTTTVGVAWAPAALAMLAILAGLLWRRPQAARRGTS